MSNQNADFSLAAKLVYLGENESTALMDNAGEGTSGIGLWEGKSNKRNHSLAFA